MYFFGSGKLSGSNVNEHLTTVYHDENRPNDNVRNIPFVLLHPETIEVKDADVAVPVAHALQEPRYSRRVIVREERSRQPETKSPRRREAVFLRRQPNHKRVIEVKLLRRTSGHLGVPFKNLWQEVVSGRDASGLLIKFSYLHWCLAVDHKILQRRIRDADANSADLLAPNF